MENILSLCAIADLLADRRGLNAKATDPLSEIMANDWFIGSSVADDFTAMTARSLCKSVFSAGSAIARAGHQAVENVDSRLGMPPSARIVFAEGRLGPYFSKAS